MRQRRLLRAASLGLGVGIFATLGLWLALSAGPEQPTPERQAPAHSTHAPTPAPLTGEAPAAPRALRPTAQALATHAAEAPAAAATVPLAAQWQQRLIALHRAHLSSTATAPGSERLPARNGT